MRGPTTANEGFDAFLDALASGEGYFLECANGHGSLPPRRVCPQCAADVSERPLPETGTVASYTVVHVATPQFADDTPYVTAIVEFDGVRLTGVLRGVDPESVTTGLTVRPTVEETATTDDRLVVFRPPT